ncbi:MAG: DUF3667 domain-containing protein [Bacteroidota bacterium]
MEQSQDRIDFKHIFQGILKVLNFERGLLLTIKEMVISPGKVVRTYLNGENRKKYTHPIQYVVMLVGAYYFLFALIPLEMNGFDGFMAEGMNISANQENLTPDQVEKMEEAMVLGQEASGLMFKYLNVFTFLTIPLTAVFTYLFYRKAKFYYTEHLVLNAYITGTYSAIGLLLLPFYLFSFFLTATASISLILYQVWAYMDIFAERDIKGGIKGSFLTLLVYLIAMILAGTALTAYMLYKLKT